MPVLLANAFHYLPRWSELSTPETIREEPKQVWCQQSAIHVYSTHSGQLLSFDPLSEQVGNSICERIVVCSPLSDRVTRAPGSQQRQQPGRIGNEVIQSL